jgi:predicted enzyme related to lactoylglutathione lyase
MSENTFEPRAAFSGFSVNDLAAAKQFYTEVLGCSAEDAMGDGLRLTLPGGTVIWIYTKPNHQPATYTVLNFDVDDVEAAVDALAARGVTFERYDGMGFEQDEKGIARGLAAGKGPDIAWFKDPAGNILSVLQDQ